MKLLRGQSLPSVMTGLARTVGGVERVERPLPKISRGQVLVKMHAAPINPNDLLMLDGSYEVNKPIGTIAGFEGSGTVVAAGGGAIARFLVGKRVACTAGDGDGTWAEYAACDATRCAPLGRDVDLAQAAMLLTNPMTATVLMSIAHRGNHRAFVHTAAGGSLGRMIGRLARRRGVAAIHVVRRAEQAEVLRAEGCEHVVATEATGGEAELRGLCEQMGARLAFDPVAGATTGLLSRVMPRGSQIVIYGMLSGAPIELDANAIVFGRMRVEGFTMYEWVERTSLWGKLRVLRGAQARLGDDLRSQVRATKALADHGEALALARGATSDGKVLFVIE